MSGSWTARWLWIFVVTIVTIVACRLAPSQQPLPPEAIQVSPPPPGQVQGRNDGSPPSQDDPSRSLEMAGDSEGGASTDDAAEPERPSLRIPQEEYAGAPLSIEDPHGVMAHFYGRLEAVARSEAGAVARISVYSDSINGAEFITSEIRHALQKRFGDAGKGWVPIAPGWPTQHHQDVIWEHHRDWLTHVVNRGDAPGGRYGLGGVLAYNRTVHSKAHFATVDNGSVGTQVSTFRLFYQAWRRGGVVRLTVDEGEPVLVSTSAEQMEDRVHDVVVADGPHRLEVRVDEGRLRLYGVVMEREGPGVVVDGLMLIGARGRRLALFDAEHFGRQVALRETDLLVFWLGANDAESSYFDRDGFLADYGAGIDHARAERPEASCLVVSITDVGEVPGGRTRRRVPRIVQAQQELALAHGCAFLNFFEVMGGEGTIRRWFRASPRLASSDYVHFTLAGARAVGQLFYQVILRSFDEHLAASQGGGPATANRVDE